MKIKMQFNEFSEQYCKENAKTLLEKENAIIPYADENGEIGGVLNLSLNKALNTSKGGSSQQDYEPHEAQSSGWCYIGEDRGYRSCAQVGVDDKCMSGDIFPSQELCMNPNLRA